MVSLALQNPEAFLQFLSAAQAICVITVIRLQFGCPSPFFDGLVQLLALKRKLPGYEGCFGLFFECFIDVLQELISFVAALTTINHGIFVGL